MCAMAAFFRRRKVVIRPKMSSVPRTDEEVLQLLRLLPRYRVLLHNDDVNTMDHVVLALIRTIPALSYESAVSIMLEAHNSGFAEVIICLKELAEHYCERLRRYTLTSTIEPA
jgi:ATP-dependent Clp protease adaptor protein ClpS